MKIFELLTEAQVGKKALDFKRSNRYPDGTNIPESLPPRYQLASNPGVPANQQCSNCGYYDPATKKCDKFKGEPAVKPSYWCLKWEAVEEDVTEGVAGPKNCWPGHRKVGTQPGTGKNKGKPVNDCKKIKEDVSADEQFDIIEEMVETLAAAHGVDPEVIWEDFESVDDTDLLDESAAWRNKSGKNKNGGLNAKGVASYRRENPGSKLQTAVTTKPSKLKPGSKAAKRRKSFCARMGGVKGPMKKPNGKPTRKALALRKWNC